MSVFYLPQVEAVLIHIPKNGGSSIRHGFFDGIYDGPEFGKVPDAWMRFFKFTFVRNPYDRLISAWKMFSSGVVKRQDQKPDCLSLMDFLDIATDESIPFHGDRSVFEIELRHHAIPQTHPYNCLDQADFVGRFENLSNDFRRVCVKIGCSGDLPHLNRTEHKPYQDYFDFDVRRVVNKFYEEDIRRLGYSFEKLELR